MSKEIIPFTTEQAWLDARVRDITSTESAALFNASPYVTAYELHHAKRSGVVERRADNERMRWGRRLQDPIAFGVAEDHGIEIESMREYIRDPDARIGSSFDYRIVGAHGTGDKAAWMQRLMLGEGLMEIKTVDPFAFKENWLVADGEVVEAPAHIELQVQHQMLVSGLHWALIVALVGGNRISVIERAYDPELGAAIMLKAREFWQLVDAGVPPAPDYMRDADLVARQYLESTAGKVLDARGDEQLAEWVGIYNTVSAHIKEREQTRAAMRARILERIGDAARVQLADGTISAGTVRESLVPAYTRSAYRNLRISQRKATT